MEPLAGKTGRTKAVVVTAQARQAVIVRNFMMIVDGNDLMKSNEEIKRQQQGGATHLPRKVSQTRPKVSQGLLGGGGGKQSTR